MHLKQLKLAGFKSFVEPTVIPFPSQLVAVVGPNGCGKSNIIDAVRWVMGESSAKNLRGASMTDVIFNGSSSRKSVGQASVELVFDNSLGRLTGQYASYQEIAVKRLLTRDGESSYYLNGSRCRRRDISDVFLGTGAGARGYAIIGQDMISRLIEARPDDLRAYLEEAAGVSKYKERRRETLQRISHARENLARVADIRDELDKQLARLERQAKAALRYQALKQDERQFKAEILALKWQALTTEQSVLQAELTQLSLQHEQYQANMSRLLKEGEVVREKAQASLDDFQRIQTTFYQTGTDIARLEESMQQQARERQQLNTDKQHLEADWQAAVNQLEQDTQQLRACEHALKDLHDNLQTLQQTFHAQQQQVDRNQQLEMDWNSQWQGILSAKNQVLREAEIEKVRLEHLEQRLQETHVRLEKINQEHVQIRIDELQAALATTQAAHRDLLKQQACDEKNYQQSVSQGSALRQLLSAIEQPLHHAQDKLQSLGTEHAVLLAAQHAAMQTMHDAAAILPWKNYPRLVEKLHVEDKWLHACELVLGDSLHAVLLPAIDEVFALLPSLQGKAAVFVTSKKNPLSQATYPRLSDKIDGITPSCLPGLESVFAAENLHEAMTWLPFLSDEQSIVTADGYWLGAGWVRVANSMQQDQQGLLARQQALVKLSETLRVAEDDLCVLQKKRDELQVSISENTKVHDELKGVLSASQDALRKSDAGLNKQQQALDNASARAVLLVEECESLQTLIEALVTDKMQHEHHLQEATLRCAQHEQQQARLIAAKTVWEEALATARREMELIRTTRHQTELHYDREKLKTQQLQESIKREQARIESLRERLQALEKRYHELNAPEAAQKLLLDEKMLHYQQLDEALSCGRLQAEALQTELASIEKASKDEEQLAKSAQDNIQQQQMQAQALDIRASNLVESLAELGTSPETFLATGHGDVTLQQREQDLLATQAQITRLGAINLVAIEEYEAERQRKQHLDEQHQDLTDALATLDLAIAKMDKETQLRLQETFDQINASFQSLFPRLFGGGRALLELTCDNLLEAGILVMAQPPGKRNSSIHMLSGGEKAMTAVALVFAIFQLNPSPFCMLDEVDAPLDDVNVKRFCDLVKEMSPFVQFLFITHNKVTMELADHLIGVTMREPGVSRVVAVDVEQALSIAE